jgi:arylsulfatase A-like enzyme
MTCPKNVRQKIRRLRWRLPAAILGTLALFSIDGFAADRKPNIVLVLLDNFGYGELGTYGGGVRRGAPTPRIDSLAREGMKLTNFNTEPVCMASRSALMTGRFAIRSGTYSAAPGPDSGLVQWEITLAEMLREVGYVSALFGKWHLGERPGRYPTDQGFDQWYGIPRSSDESMWVGSVGYDPSEVPPTHTLEGSNTEATHDMEVYDLETRSKLDGEITRRGIQFIKRQAGRRPFFAYLAMTTGHSPIVPSAEWRGKTGNGPWADVLAQLDSYIGQVLDTLKEAGIEDNTIFILTADNGAETFRGPITIGAHGESIGGQSGWAGPWRGGYVTAMEGGLRVPFLIRWPRKIRAGTESDEIVHLVDMFPTLAKIVGGDIPSDRVIDGVDQSEFLLGKRQQSNRDFFPIYDMKGQVAAVKWKHWKVHFYQQAYSDEPPLLRRQVTNLLVDPLEMESALGYTWVLWAVNKRISEVQASLTKFPAIKPHTPDPYEPPRPPYPSTSSR